MKTSSKMLCGLGLLLGTVASLQAAEVTAPRIIDSSTTWTSDNTYILAGYTFVVTPAEAQTETVLTIEPGTVIKGAETTGSEAAALIVTSTASIDAEGTANNPIIFTSVLDDLDGTLTHEDVQLWGGVIILGNASINSRSDGEIVAAPIQDQIEGVSVSGSEVDFITFGGTDDEDSSGIFKYVSIRHGGAVIGSDNEINGLTLGGVGRGTTIEFVEVFANKDDGIEWFGGTVNARYLAVAFCNDDSFDYDQGWRGYGQFWFTIGTDITLDRMDKGGEHDGATSPVDATPFGMTSVYNATFIGIGDALQPDGVTPGRANTALNIRDNAGSKYYNSVFVDFAKMINVESDNETRFNAGDVDLQNNIFWSHIADNNNAAGLNDGAIDATVFFTDGSKNNSIVDPMLSSIGRDTDGSLDPRPAAGSPALSGALYPVPAENDFLVPTSYKGAFAADYNWLIGWTKLSEDGYLGNSGGGTWFFHSTLGWIYLYEGQLQGWVFVSASGTLAYIYNDLPSGTNVFLAK